MIESTGHVRVGDIQMFVLAVGTGPPLLTIHGGPGLGHVYLRPLDALADDHRVIYFDQRGAGRTEPGDPSKLTFAGALEDLDGLRAALGLERVDLLAHSIGGHLAYLYAARQPEHVGRVVLVDVGPPFDEELGERMGAAFEARLDPEDVAERSAIEASGSFRRREPEAVERWVRSLYAPFFDDRAIARRLAYGLTRIGASTVVGGEERIMATLAELDPLGSLGEIRSPTLVVHGERDPIPAAFSKLLADAIPGARFELIPGVNHFAFIEDPGSFLPPVRAFLSEQ